MKMKFFILFITFCIISHASIIAQVQSIQGNVKVKHQNSFKKKKLKNNTKINDGDLISTYKNATAILKLIDGSKVILENSSTIHFKSLTNLEQKSGKIFYQITSRNAKNSLKVKTPFAIIGIKGTTFIINATNNYRVSLKEGVIGVQSLKEEFELYQETQNKEFENFKKKDSSSFEEYKNKHNKSLIKRLKEFDLDAGNTLIFNGLKVNKKDTTSINNAEFLYFEKLISETNE